MSLTVPQRLVSKGLIIFSVLNIAPARANISSTAAPVANSSGSVTNQAVQVVPSRQFTYSLGSGISCQGATLNISPFISGTHSLARPLEYSFMEPVYDMRDNEGLFDDDNQPIGDGAPDNPGDVLFYRERRTNQKDNTSINGGLTATFSIPLDRQAVRLCKQAMEKQVELFEASLAAKRLNYEIGRLKSCSKYRALGIYFAEDSPVAPLCRDVIVGVAPGQVLPHNHNIPEPTASKLDVKSLQLGSGLSEQGLSRDEKEQQPSSPFSFLRNLWPFSRSVSPASESNQPEVSQEELNSWRLQRSQPFLKQGPHQEAR